MPDKNQEILPPLAVEKMVNGGAGLARHQGQVVFIPHTAVGDKVLCRLIRKKKHFSEAVLVELLESGPDRRKPPCPVAGVCGGCQWQHLDYSEQLRWKERLFHETLERQCGVESDRILPIVASTDEWSYRSRVQVKCHNTKDGFVTGFYRPKSRFVVSIDECPIIDPSLNQILTRLRNLFRNSKFARFIPQLDLAVDDYGKIAVTVHYIGRNRSGLLQLLSDADLEVDLLLQAGTKSSLKVIEGNGLLDLRVGDPELRLSYAVGSFAQINLDQNRRLIEMVVGQAALGPSDRAVDLYCGMGNFTLPLACSGAEIVGIEESSSSIARAVENARINDIVNCRFICGCAIEEYGKLAGQGSLDLLVLDPPRIGAYDVMKAIVDNPPAKIIYISCDPQTLARDLKVLVNHSYRVLASRPFDLFPQTYHCESVTVLELR